MPHPSFFTSENKIPVGQKKISVRAENGLSYQLGQQIDFVIPSGIDYMMPSETYLRMDVKISHTSGGAGAVTRLMLDEIIGGNVLIRDVQIRSGGAQNVLLEEIQNANVLTALKYDYETNDNIQQKRALTEGAQVFDVANRSTLGSENSGANALLTNSYSFAQEGTTAALAFKTVKCLIKIPGGIFESSKVFPLGLTEGLRVTLLLENSNRVFRQTHNVMQHRAVQANPYFHSLNGSFGAPSTWAASAVNASGYVFLNNTNSINSIEQCPFVIGEALSFRNVENGNDVAGSFTGEIPIISAIDFITSVANGNDGAGLIRLTVAAAGACTNSSIFNITSANYAYSRALDLPYTFAPTLAIDNVELLVQEVTMPEGYTSKMKSMLKSGGAMNYDFTSFTNYKYSQLASDRVVNIRLPIQASRCKSILAIPTDASVYSVADAVNSSGTYLVNKINADCGRVIGGVNYGENRSTRSGLTGIADNATDYQFVYDGKLNPSRKVPVGRISIGTNPTGGAATDGARAINQQWLIECEKALYMAGIEPLSFRAYQDNFFIGRALSLQNGVYDARGRDFNLQVEYTDTLAPTKNHLWCCFVAHIRRIVVRGEQISIEV